MDSLMETLWSYAGFPTRNERILLMKKRLEKLTREYELERCRLEFVYMKQQERLKMEVKKKNIGSMNTLKSELTHVITPMAQTKLQLKNLSEIISKYQSMKHSFDNIKFDREMLSIMSDLLYTFNPVFMSEKEMQKMSVYFEKLKLNSEMISDSVGMNFPSNTIENEVDDISHEIYERFVCVQPAPASRVIFLQKDDDDPGNISYTVKNESVTGTA